MHLKDLNEFKKKKSEENSKNKLLNTYTEIQTSSELSPLSVI